MCASAGSAAAAFTTTSRPRDASNPCPSTKTWTHGEPPPGPLGREPAFPPMPPEPPTPPEPATPPELDEVPPPDPAPPDCALPADEPPAPPRPSPPSGDVVPI